MALTCAIICCWVSDSLAIVVGKVNTSQSAQSIGRHEGGFFDHQSIQTRVSDHLFDATFSFGLHSAARNNQFRLWRADAACLSRFISARDSARSLAIGHIVQPD